MQKNKSHPGPQKKLGNFDVISLFLHLLLFCMFLLLSYSILKDNSSLMIPNIQKFLKFQFLDTKSIFTVFISLVGLVLVRHHFIQSFRPRINYELNKVEKGATNFLHKDESVWQAKIINAGLGPAVIEDYCFRTSENDEYSLSFDSLVHKLESFDLILDVDYSLNNVTKGYTISAKDSLIAFELVLYKGEKIKCLDIQIQFKGFLGDNYRKEIFCIPRKGINNLI